MDTNQSIKNRSTLSISQIGLFVLLGLTAIALPGIPLITRQMADFSSTATSIPRLVALVYLICAAWILIFQRQSRLGRVFVIFAASMAIFMIGWSDLSQPGWLTAICSFGLTFSSASLLDLSLLLVQPSLLSRWRWLRSAAYLLAVLIWSLVLLSILLPAFRLAYSATWLSAGVFAGISGLVFMALAGLKELRRSKYSPDDSNRALFVVALLAFVPPLVGWIGSPFWQTSGAYSPWWLTSLLVFAPVAGLIVQNQARIQADYLASRIAIYTSLLLIIAGGYALLVTGLGLILSPILGAGALLV